MQNFIKTVLFSSLFTLTAAQATDTPQSLLNTYSAQAQAENAQFKGFDAQRGQLFFNNKHGNDWSCATCHTHNPAQAGKHARTSKTIEPLSPNANASRFSDVAKVEKWFKRNCKDVVERECNALEKGDVLTYVLSVK